MTDLLALADELDRPYHEIPIHQHVALFKQAAAALRAAAAPVSGHERVKDPSDVRYWLDQQSLAAVAPSEGMDIKQQLELALREYNECIARTKDDGALSETGRETILRACAEGKAAVKAFAERLASLRPSPAPPDCPVGLASGCCSASSPCNHQKLHPDSICDTCKKAGSVGAPAPAETERGGEHPTIEWLAREIAQKAALMQAGKASFLQHIIKCAETILERLATFPECEDRLREAMQEACDLLSERVLGSPARSPGHNARLRLERALAGEDAATKSAPALASSLPSGESGPAVTLGQAGADAGPGGRP